MTTLNEDLIYEILSAVEEIPAGKVASYGQIAQLIGKDRNARLVGKVLSISEYYGEYPCHRVVNHAGRTAPGWREQRGLLVPGRRTGLASAARQAQAAAPAHAGQRPRQSARGAPSARSTPQAPARRAEECRQGAAFSRAGA